MSVLYRLTALVALLFWAAPPAAHAQAPRASLLSTSTGEGVREAFGGVIDRIVRSRLDALDAVTVQGSVALDMNEIQLALGCVGETPECLGQVAEQIDVDVLLLSNVDRVGDELILSVARYSRDTGEIRRVARRAGGDDAETQILDAVDGLLRELFDLPPAPETDAVSEDDVRDRDETRDADVTTPSPAPAAEPAIAGPAIVLGVGAVTLAAGVVTGVLFLDEANAYAVTPTTPEEVLERDAHRASAEDLALATNVLLVGGGVVAAAGVAWLLVEVIGVGSSGSGEGEGTTLTPMVGPQVAGLLVGGALPEIP